MDDSVMKLLQTAGLAVASILGAYWVWRGPSRLKRRGTDEIPSSKAPPDPAMNEDFGGWPNDEAWSALRQGDMVTEGERCRLSVVEAGDLRLPSGRLVACDPFAGMKRGGNPWVQAPPGKYPVRVTLADVSKEQDGSHIREAYASVLLANSPEARRRILTPLQEGQSAPALKPGEFVGFPVDAGTACFVDDRALVTGMPPEDGWLEDLFENDDPGSWFSRMDDPGHIREGIANIPLPLAKDGANAVIIHSGWGDGLYPVIGGYDAKGELVAVHIDFMVIGPAEEAGDESPGEGT